MKCQKSNSVAANITLVPSFQARGLRDGLQARTCAARLPIKMPFDQQNTSH